MEVAMMEAVLVNNKSVSECELWDLSGGSLSAFSTAWRKTLRRIWNLPFKS